MPKHKTVTSSQGGRPEITLTDDDLAMLERASGFMNAKQCAALLGIHENTMTKLRRRDERINMIFKKNTAHKNLAVAEAMFRNATEKMNPISQIFWMKAHGNWVEAVHEYEQPIINISYSAATEREARPAIEHEVSGSDD